MNKDEMIERIKYLEKRVAKFDEYFTKFHDDQIEKDPRSRLAKMVLTAVKDRVHPLLVNVDLIYARDLAQLMRTVYPSEKEFFYHDGELDTAARRMGALLGKVKLFAKLKTRVTVPAYPEEGSKRTTHNMNIWVLRNYQLYRHISPHQLYRDHYQRWRNACIEYSESLKLEEQVSFM